MNIDSISLFQNRYTKNFIFFSLIAVLWLTYGVSPGISLPWMTNYPNFYLPSVYLSFSSDTHIVPFNLSKREAMCFYLLLQNIRIHSLNFLYTKIEFLVSTNVLQYIFISCHLVYTLFTCMCLICDCDVIYVCLWSKFLWRMKLTFIVVLMICQLWCCANQ